jgi:hypothetical protein
MTDITPPFKIMPVELCGAVGKCMASPQSYASSLQNTYSTPKPARVAAFALEKLEAARKLDEETHAKNETALANNKLVHDAVKAFMDALGMPKRFSVPDHKSRSRFPKTISHDAGYLTDLVREVRVSDNFDQATRTYNDLRTRYVAYKEQADREAEQEKRNAEQAEERAKAARRANIELAAIILRYSLDLDATWEDVLDALRGKHQRVDLAVAMMNVRHDWNDGPGEVSRAMDGFTIETTEDKDIANSVLSNLGDGWDGDGRCFRDCEWNYDRLLASLPDEQLRADVLLAFQRRAMV